jgi:hypothetical protein
LNGGKWWGRRTARELVDRPKNEGKWENGEGRYYRRAVEWGHRGMAALCGNLHLNVGHPLRRHISASVKDKQKNAAMTTKSVTPPQHKVTKPPLQRVQQFVFA